MLTRVVVLALLLLPSLAVADPADTPPRTAHATEQHRFALAVNEPFGWAAGAFGASGYAALGQHVALRANLARYRYYNAAVDLLEVLLFDSDGDASFTGGFFDAGAGVTWFPRKLWSGPTFELGMNVRSQHTKVEDEFADVYSVQRDVRTYAARGLAGWSWLIDDRWFVALAVGASYGAQRGTETTIATDYHMDMPMTRPVRGGAWSAESYLRLGVTF